MEVPPTVTVKGPEIALEGTATMMLVLPQLRTEQLVPFSVTVLLPCVAPKLTPAIVTQTPASPDVGVMLVILGAVVTVYGTALLVPPETVTVTFPVEAPDGTGTRIEESFHKFGVPVKPLKLTELEPWVVPKFAPKIVTGVVIGPLLGHRPAM